MISLIGAATEAAIRNRAYTPLSNGAHHPNGTGETVTLPPCAASAHDARRYVRDALTALNGTAAVDTDVAELLVSELVTNAVHYGEDGHIHLTLTATGTAIRIEVVNPGCDTGPVLGEPDDADEGGRGLLLVDALATAWGSQVDGGRTVVWAELPRTPIDTPQQAHEPIKDPRMVEYFPKGVSISGRQRAELRAELKAAYASGSSIRALAVATGRSYGFVHRLLKEAGVEFRARGGARYP